MKKAVLVLMTLIIGMLIGVAAGPDLRRTGLASDPMVVSHAGPTLEAVRSLASLVTTKVTVSDVQLTELQGYTGGAKAALLIRGDFTLGTDLNRAEFTSVDSAAKTIVLRLPRPTPDSPRVDLSRTRLVSVGTSGLWDIVPGHDAESAVADQAYREAQIILDRASRQAIWIDQAQRQAEQVIATFFISVGWKAEVRWASD